MVFILHGLSVEIVEQRERLCMRESWRGLCMREPWRGLCMCEPWRGLCMREPWRGLCTREPWRGLCTREPWRRVRVHEPWRRRIALRRAKSADDGMGDHLTCNEGHNTKSLRPHARRARSGLHSHVQCMIHVEPNRLDLVVTLGPRPHSLHDILVCEQSAMVRRCV
jgi:hypothetical protein